MENRSREYREGQWKNTFQKHHPNEDWDLSLSNGKYIDNNTPIEIVCPNGHIVKRTPGLHVKRGCPFCKAERSKRLVFGVGVNDLLCACNEKVYVYWHSMLRRCFSSYAKKRNPSYYKSTVCDEWLVLSNFKKWFDDNYIEGYQLDKDVLVKGNHKYSPKTCCFIPQALNKLLIRNESRRGNLPIGVCFVEGKGKYSATLSIGPNTVHLGYFTMPEEAFQVYKTAKEDYIKRLARKYYVDGKITWRVFVALLKYEIDIRD